MALVGYFTDRVQDMLNFDNPWKITCMTIGSLIVAKKGLTKLLRFVTGKYLHEEDTKREYQHDVVYLFMFPAKLTKQIPNLSPYAIKVETWLKLKKIKYEVIETIHFSKDTRQIPYIQLNGVFVSDSTVIIDHLRSHFNIDPEEGLTPEQLGASQAIQRMVDDAMSWTYLVDRYVYRKDIFAKFFRPQGRYRFMQEKIRNVLNKMFDMAARNQGTGRQPRKVVEMRGHWDLKAISLYLGDKDFLMGDQITTVDCAVFGHLSQITFVDFPYAVKELLNTDYINVRHYTYRMRQRLWPDWFMRSDSGEFIN